MSAKKKSLPVGNGQLFEEIRSLIEETRSTVATTVNAALTMLYWRIGKRINEDILQGESADYGEQIVSALGRQLSWTHFKATTCLAAHQGKPKEVTP